MRPRRSLRLSILIAVGLLAAGCGHDVTAPGVTAIAAHRARWTAHALTRYAYDYRVVGTNISTAGKLIHLVVIDGTVNSATIASTGESAPGAPGSWPTIDALFDEADAAARAHGLDGIVFDASLDYPAELDLAGPPDAARSEFASGVQPLPTGS